MLGSHFELQVQNGHHLPYWCSSVHSNDVCDTCYSTNVVLKLIWSIVFVKLFYSQIYILEFTIVNYFETSFPIHL